eukprot:1665841-Amphidinium_carterae.1
MSGGRPFQRHSETVTDGAAGAEEQYIYNRKGDKVKPRSSKRLAAMTKNDLKYSSKVRRKRAEVKVKMTQKKEAMKARALLSPVNMDGYVIEGHSLGRVEKVAARNGRGTPTDAAETLRMRRKIVETFWTNVLGAFMTMSTLVWLAIDWPDFNSYHHSKRIAGIFYALKNVLNRAVSASMFEDWGNSVVWSARAALRLMFVKEDGKSVW